MPKKPAPPKSAFELAMDRLSAKDRAEGIARRPLTAAQKERIAELRRQAGAKLAELEIMHHKSVTEAGGDAEKRGEVDRHYEIDRQRITAKLESDVRRAREGDLG